MIQISVPILLLILTTTQAQDLIYGQSCVIPTVTTFCTETLNEYRSCHVIGGELRNKTCTQLGFDVGRCCSDGFCGIATQDGCEVVEGIWSEGEVCPCPDLASSCCVEGECYEGYSERGCVEIGGVYMEDVPCGQSKCAVIESLLGGCIVDVDTCYDIPESYCFGSWAEASCVELGYVREPAPVVDENSTYPGRCCTDKCREKAPVDCNLNLNYYEYGVGCSAGYSCTPHGACLSDYGNNCIESVPLELCNSMGGTLIEGGNCPEQGACYLGERCNIQGKGFCEDLGGTWSNETTCPSGLGACCSRFDGCSVKQNRDCSIVGSTFHLGKSCEEVNCEESSCCAYEFCIPHNVVPLSVCLSKLPRSRFLDQQCPASGTCSDVIVIENDNSDTGISASVNNISLSTKNSTVSFIGMNVSSSKVDLNKTSFTINTLNLDSTTMNIDFSSGLTVESSLTLNSASLQVSLTQEELLELTDQDKVLIQAGKIEGDFSATVSVDGITSDKVKLVKENNTYYLHLYTEETTEETTENNSNNDIVSEPDDSSATIIIVCAVSAVAVIAGVIIFVFREKIIQPYE
eukprot:TRINITY_DN1106_c0_g1_i5.p1 TRINITY_DN1106_c0_g1~~TRINITY_DN1106_c0_g1_i5.p1  ORF type:complete len:586 (-),score=111.04 TRINITY_DN1106_c0_g1_i5:25-1749(-)